MRKAILFTLISLLLACGAVAQKAENPETVEAAAVIEGKIQSAGPSIYMEGSHELVDTNGELLARLSGLEFKVDLDSYQNQWVKLTGAWRPTVEAGGKIFEVRSAEKATTPEATTPKGK